MIERKLVYGLCCAGKKPLWSNSSAAKTEQMSQPPAIVCTVFVAARCSPLQRECNLPHSFLVRRLHRLASGWQQACLEDVFPAPIACGAATVQSAALAYATMQPEALPQELNLPPLNR